MIKIKYTIEKDRLGWGVSDWFERIEIGSKRNDCKNGKLKHITDERNGNTKTANISIEEIRKRFNKTNI